MFDNLHYACYKYFVVFVSIICLHAEHRAEPTDAVRASVSVVEREQACTAAVVEAASTHEERTAQVRKGRVVLVPAVLAVCSV